MVRWVRAVCLAIVCGLFAGGEAQAKWLRAETKHFVLYSDGSERELRDYATKLEVFDEALRFFHPARDDGPAVKLDIYLLRDDNALKRIWPKPGAVAGFYSADPEGTLAVGLRNGGDFTDQILFHEYTHHFMLRYFAYPYPSWLVEGWAEYFGSSTVFRDRIDVGLPNNERGSSLDSWYVSSRDLFTKPSSELPAGAWAVFYARAWLLTHFMLSDDTRRGQLNEYMRLVGEGGDPMDSLERALGYDIPTLDRKLRQYLEQRIRYTTIQRKDVPVPMTITALSPAADAVLLERVRLVSGVGMKEAPGALKIVQFRANGHENDRLAQLTLARAHIMLGDPANAEPILQPYLSDAKDAEALYLMGMRYSRMAEKELGYDDRRARAEAEAEKNAGKDDKDKPLEAEAVPTPEVRERAAAWYAKARPWFAKANRADPESYEVLFAFARSRELDPDYPTAGTLEILAAAYERAPQVDAITMANAKALISHRRYGDASKLLALLANDPHGGATARRAKAMLDELAGAAIAKPN